MDLYHGIPIIDTEQPATNLSHPAGQSYGFAERDYCQYPQEMLASPEEMQIIPESEWDARFDEQEATESSLEHIFLSGPNGTPAFDNLDQDGLPDCWCHSTCHTVMLDRLKRNLPTVRFNAVAVATMLKKTNGAWAGLSAQFAAEQGLPIIGTTPGTWPYQSRKGKDTPELRAAMVRYKIEEDFVDLTKQVYDQNLTRSQLATCLFSNIPCAVDFSWWGHSVAALRWVRISKGEWGLLVLNSWGADWGRHGLGVLQGSKMIPMGAVATRVTSASA